MTARHTEIAQGITDYLNRAGYAPSVKDVATMINRGTSVAFRDLEIMRDLRLVDWVSGEPRTLHLTELGHRSLRRARSFDGRVLDQLVERHG